MTLQENLQALYELQQIDSHIQRAKRSLAALDTGAEAKAKADAARQAHTAEAGALSALSGELKDSELKLTALETKLKQYQQKLYQGTVTNAKELANIEKEIDALGRQRGTLDERILQLMDDVEQQRGKAGAAKAEAEAAEAQHAEVVAASRNRSESLTLEIAGLNRRRAEAAAAVQDVALLKRYDEIRDKSQGVGIAKIQDNNCGGCRMTLPSGLVKAVKDAQELQTCENCRRILMA